ncbi:Diacetylchitobiose uptake system permease protein NgcF [Paenibacillus allorhizoplanae]|uniref:Diacetylchitobiose uptake system permease protein NgcF n=1 Tax=Paenibacillus allorhizoplanae TaxID=2905648 RepID=A0ABN8HAG0_9BACL|nr:sugar ABC transporter permease [Paenibacillus allorhizoplanae]CAH1231118.1 Diacetylchitobiose uptake system permease protein NgcF [Paenibacillus allorhizoplanae]
MSNEMQKRVIVLSFLALPIGLLLLFLIYPTTKLFQYSMTDWNGISREMHFVGFDNYLKAFKMSQVWQSLSNNWLYFIIHALLIPFEILLAVMLNAKMRASEFFRSIILLPYIINGVAVAYIFSYLYNPINGPINELLTAVGLESWIHNWLSDVKIVNYSLVAISLWRFAGFHIILFLAGVQSIPNDLYEAATIDGANKMQQVRYIVLPGIRRVIEIILFLNIRGALQVFDIPFLVTQGGPGTSSSTFTIFTINTAFKFNSYGLASAMAIILMLMIIVFSFIQNLLIREKGEKSS